MKWLAVLLMLCTALASAEERELIGASQDGMQFYILPDRFKTLRPNVYSIWTEQVPKRRQQVYSGQKRGPMYVRALVNRTVDCKAETLQATTAFFYDKDGSVHSTQDYEQPMPYAPGSVAESLYLRVCGEWERP